MRSSRVAFALAALGMAGAGVGVVVLPGSAVGADTRFNLEARGDAWYFEVNGEEIPFSAENDAGSLTAAAETTNVGGSKGFAGMPYFGNTLQTLPGTMNGLPSQFGAGDVPVLPFTVFPGYVSSASNGVAEDAQDYGYGRVSSASTESGAVSSAAYGAPEAVAAPNQQQTARATTEHAGTAVVASAAGSSSGLTTGPLEIAHSAAKASISQRVGEPAVIEAETFGRFSVGGQAFGFDRNGFTYLGEQMPSDEAIEQANATLAAAGIQVELAPETQETDAAGRLIYSIGGLKVTTTQPSPTGSGADYTLTYVLGRAQVGATIATLGSAAERGQIEASSTAGVERPGAIAPTAGGQSPMVVDRAGSVRPVSTAQRPAESGPSEQARTVPTEDLGVAAPGDQTWAAAPDQPAVRQLGLVAQATPTGEDSEWLYGMLLIAGVAILGGHLLFTRLAAA